MVITAALDAGIALVDARVHNDASGSPALRRFRAGLEYLVLRHWRRNWGLGLDPLQRDERRNAEQSKVLEDFVQLEYRHRWAMTFDTVARFVPRHPHA